MAPNQRHNLYLSEKSAREENIAGRRRFNEARAISSIDPSSYRLSREREAVLSRHQWQYREMQGRNCCCGPDGEFSMILDNFLKLRRICSDGMGNYDGELNDDRSGNNDEALPTAKYVITQLPKPYFIPKSSALHTLELLSLVCCPALGKPRYVADPATSLYLLFLQKAL
jgi:hypothetical protein